MHTTVHILIPPFSILRCILIVNLYMSNKSGILRILAKKKTAPPDMGDAALHLKGRNSVAENLVIAKGIALLPAAVARVAFNGIYTPILNFLHDTYMVR